MKIILFLCLSIILIPVVVTAAPVNLTWDTYTDTADGFKLYWGEATRNYCCWLDLGLVTESGVVDIPYFNFITLTAYRICTQELIDYTDPNDPTYQHPCVDIGLNGLWESEYSNEIYWSWVAMAYNGSISWQWIEPLPRITEGLTVFYDFDAIEPFTDKADDVNLQIISGTVNLISNGIQILSDSKIHSNTPPTTLYDSLTASNELTVEAWVKPANTTQTGPARIVTYSIDAYNRNFTLGQDGDRYQFRIRTDGSTANGSPYTYTLNGTASTNVSHLVVTFKNQVVTIYINNEVAATNTVAGATFSNWDNSYIFGLANEIQATRTWLGEIYLIAIYNRALTAAEISTNYSAGHAF